MSRRGLAVVVIACLPLVACTTVDRSSVTSAEANYLDAVADLGGFDADKLETGSQLCQLWADLIAEGGGLPTGSMMERGVLEKKGASGPDTEAYAVAADTHLCPGTRKQARTLYNSTDRSFVDGGDVEPNPDSGDGYQFGD